MEPHKSLVVASRNLRRVLRSGEAESILDKYELNSWVAGGCYPLAMAVKKWLGRGEVVGLVSEGFIQHAAVRADGLFIDGDGIATEADFRLWWRGIIARHYALNVKGVQLEIEPIMKVRGRIRSSFSEHSQRGAVDAIYGLLQEKFPMKERP